MPRIRKLKSGHCQVTAAAVEAFEDVTEVEDKVLEDALEDDVEEDVKAELEKPINM